MLKYKKEADEEGCFYSCSLGYVKAKISTEEIEFMVDSGSMVNVLPESIAQDLGLEIIKVQMRMSGVGGHKSEIKGVVELCPIMIGRFTGPVHFFISPQAQECILGQPFLFDYHCSLEYN